MRPNTKYYYVTLREYKKYKGKVQADFDTLPEAKAYADKRSLSLKHGEILIIWVNCPVTPLDAIYYIKWYGCLYHTRARLYVYGKDHEYTPLWEKMLKILKKLREKACQARWGMSLLERNKVLRAKFNYTWED